MFESASFLRIHNRNYLQCDTKYFLSITKLGLHNSDLRLNAINTML